MFLLVVGRLRTHRSWWVCRTVLGRRGGWMQFLFAGLWRTVHDRWKQRFAVESFEWP
jgi:hypothetical protein